MAQIEKVEAVTQTKCPPAHLVDYFKNSMSKLVVLAPQHFTGAELVEGEEGRVGCVILFKYNLGGRKTAKVKIIEDIDDVEKSVSFAIIEGDAMELYKSYKAKFSVVDASHVKWCVEVEKVNDSCPKPDNYLSNSGHQYAGCLSSKLRSSAYLVTVMKIILA